MNLSNIMPAEKKVIKIKKNLKHWGTIIYFFEDRLLSRHK